MATTRYLILGSGGFAVAGAVTVAGAGAVTVAIIYLDNKTNF
jgi:hypothetical protein